MAANFALLELTAQVHVCMSKSEPLASGRITKQFSVRTLGGAWEVAEVLFVLRLTGGESWQVWGPLRGDLM